MTAKSQGMSEAPVAAQHERLERERQGEVAAAPRLEALWAGSAPWVICCRILFLQHETCLPSGIIWAYPPPLQVLRG